MRHSTLRRVFALQAFLGVAIVFGPVQSGFPQAPPNPDGAAPALPSDPARWINSSPLSLESLKGKAMFLWFFEESCPKCRAKWPDLLTTARKFQGKPIVFVAVNSGTLPSAVLSYVRQNRINWPVIVDADRTFEKQCGVSEVSGRNIIQVKIITADGQMRAGRWSNVEETIDTALKGASWKVDPSVVPSGLRQAWMAIEMNDYKSAARIVNRALTSAKTDEKQAAEKLMAAVQAEIDKDLAAAKSALEQGNKWEAYNAYSLIKVRFAGYDLPQVVDNTRQELIKDAAVKAEVKGAKALDSAKRMVSTPRSTVQKRGVLQLRRIIKDMPETKAAEEARALLKQLGVN